VPVAGVGYVAIDPTRTTGFRRLPDMLEEGSDGENQPKAGTDLASTIGFGARTSRGNPPPLARISHAV